MFVATVVLSVLLAAVVAFSARGKLVQDRTIMRTMRTVGASDTLVRGLAYVEIAAAVGLLVGIGIAWIGALAAAGLTFYFLFALVAHLRVGDRNVAPAAVLLVVSIAVLVLRSQTA
ncbi:DoxX family protein [Pseudokineococcus marinus]|uniref:DoxX family protein n=1 Tax=Pseudokineococcus marinus TaxID=351215 RepID=A0A849BKZ0_9ACTN|nr:DoxX family protein [Pseudokineococcus marinus]NNH23949.1 DoxX family protein [Pseudokineococcus marinus]